MSARVGAYLATHRLPHGDRARLAEKLKVSARTLRNWRARALLVGVSRPAHRPSTDDLHGEDLREAVRVWRKLPSGFNGAGTLREKLAREKIVLGKRPAGRLVNWLKAMTAKHANRRILARRVSHEVQARDLWWSCDESFLGRDAAREAIWALFVREVFSRRTYPLSVGRAASGEELAVTLEKLAVERGGWPWILSLDNGGANRSEIVADVLKEHQVIVLFNQPHTPQHNPFGERAIGQHKQASGVEEVARRLGPECDRAARCAVLHHVLRRTSETLDNTPRAACGGLTPLELDSSAKRADDIGCRDRFYADARAALEGVAQQQLAPRARRRAEREAIFCSLERHGMLNRFTGGGRSSRPSKRK